MACLEVAREEYRWQDRTGGLVHIGSRLVCCSNPSGMIDHSTDWRIVCLFYITCPTVQMVQKNYRLPARQRVPKAVDWEYSRSRYTDMQWMPIWIGHLHSWLERRFCHRRANDHPSIHPLYVFPPNGVEWTPKHHLCLLQNRCSKDMGADVNGILVLAECLVPAS